jgi:hypothetical protein
MRVWGVIIVIGLVVWGVTTLVHHHNVGNAEGNLGQTRVAAIESVASAIVADYYAHPTKGGGSWGQQTCDAYNAESSVIGLLNNSVETVFADRVDRYWDSDPHHKSMTELHQKPTLAEIQANC